MSRLIPYIRAWFGQWPKRQPWRDLPAIIACLLGIATGFGLKSWKPSAIRTHYTQIAKQSLSAGDFQTARIACQRLLALGSESRAQTLFDLALALKGLGQEQEAATLVEKVAPLEKPVYAPAHLYVAKALMSGTNSSQQTLRAILAHLNHVVTLEPESVEANEILGRYYYQQKEWGLAKKHFLPVVGAKPELMFLLAHISAELLDDRGAQGWRERALSFFKSAVENSTTDLPKQRLCYAEALVDQEEYALAIAELEEGRKLSASESYRLAMGEVYASWAQSVAKKEPDNLGLQIKLVQQGLDQAPQSRKLLEQLVQLSRGDGPDRQAVREKLNQLLAQGGSSALLHFLTGSDAWQRGDLESAKKHFSVAFDLAPNIPEIANNMAVILSQGPAGDLPRALAIIDSAVKMLPDQPELRDTRGGILLKMGRWKEAVKDLEFALPLLTTKEATHQALAQAYAAMGMDDLASEHRRLAKPPAN